MGISALTGLQGLSGIVKTPVTENPPWTPENLSTKFLWFDGADTGTLTIVNGNQITQWDDKSGNNHHATTASGTNPTTATRNSRTAVATTSSQHMVISNAVSPITDGYFAIVLCELTADPTSTQVPFYSGDSNANGYGLRVSSAKQRGYLFGGVNQNLHGPNVVIGALEIWAFEFVSGTTNFRYNGGQVGARGSKPVAPGGSSWIGSTNNGGASANCVICEILIASGDVQIAEGYIAHKWGLAGNLPSGHPYKQNPPV